jgi:hypothetical protein
MLNSPLRSTLMKSKIITALGAISLVLGMFALQGCYESNYPGYGGGYGGYGYGYGSGPGYYSQPVVVEHRTWHDRWWGGDHHDRDDDHHEGWRGNSERNEHEGHGDHDRD